VVERTKEEIGEEVLTASSQLSSVFSESSSSTLDKTDDDGNESGDLCASQGEVERTKEDDDFIDKDDDDDLEDYAGTQNFNDERPEDHKGRWSKDEDKQKVYIYISYRDKNCNQSNPFLGVQRSALRNSGNDEEEKSHGNVGYSEATHMSVTNR